MDDLATKVKKFQDSCLKLAKEEANDLNLKIDSNIKNETEDEISKYEKEANHKWERQIYKLEKDFNSKVYEARNSSKIAIISKENELMNSLEQELTKRLYMFTDLREYDVYILNNVKEVLDSLDNKNNENVTIYLTQKDFEKYENQIKTEFNCNVDLTSEELIGGCIGENLSQNLLIDNSLKTLLTEEIKKTNFKI